MATVNFVQQIQIACEQEGLPASPPGFLEPVWEFFGWMSRKVTLFASSNSAEEAPDVVRCKLQTGEMSPSSLAELNETALDAIFSEQASNKRLEQVTMQAIVGSSGPAQLRIITVFQRTFEASAARIQRLLTPDEQALITHTLAAGQEAVRIRDHKQLKESVQMLKGLQQTRALTADATQALEKLSYERFEVVYEELTGEHRLPPVINGIIREYIALPDDRIKRQIEEELTASKGLLTASIRDLIKRIDLEYFTSLTLRKLPLSDTSKELFDLLPGIKELIFVDCNIWFGAMDMVSSCLPELEVLQLNNNYTLFYCYKPLFQKLKVLRLDGEYYSDDYFDRMPPLPALEKLALTHSKAYQALQAPLPRLAQKFPRMTHLDLSYSRFVTKKLLEGLEKLTHLQELSLTIYLEIEQGEMRALNISSEEIEALRLRFPRLSIRCTQAIATSKYKAIELPADMELAKRPTS